MRAFSNSRKESEDSGQTPRRWPECFGQAPWWFSAFQCHRERRSPQCSACSSGSKLVLPSAGNLGELFHWWCTTWPVRCADRTVQGPGGLWAASWSGLARRHQTYLRGSGEGERSTRVGGVLVRLQKVDVRTVALETTMPIVPCTRSRYFSATLNNIMLLSALQVPSLG